MTARYLSPLRLESLAPSKGGKKLFKVLAPFIYDSDVLKLRITVPEGFVTDLGTVPRLPFAYMLFGGASNEAAVVHDFLYSGQAGKVTRAQADDVFFEAMKAEGVAGWRRGPMWFGVRMVGWWFYEKPAGTAVAG